MSTPFTALRASLVLAGVGISCWAPDVRSIYVESPLRLWDVDRDGDLDLGESRTIGDGYAYFQRDAGSLLLASRTAVLEYATVFSTMDGVSESIAVERYGDDSFHTGLNAKRVHRRTASVEVPGISVVRGDVFGARPSRSQANDTVVLTLVREKESGALTLDVAAILGTPVNESLELRLGERRSVPVGHVGECDVTSIGYIPGKTKDYLVFGSQGGESICIVEYAETTQMGSLQTFERGRAPKPELGARWSDGYALPCLDEAGIAADDCFALHLPYDTDDDNEDGLTLQKVVKSNGKWQREGDVELFDRQYRQLAYARLLSPDALQPVLLGESDALVLSLREGISVQQKIGGLASLEPEVWFTLGFIDMDGDGLDDLAGSGRDTASSPVPVTFLNKSGTFVRQ